MGFGAKWKKRLYFVVAGYFRFFANFALRRWHPRVVAITGSAGKTTLLHLCEFEFGGRGHYSHFANSAFGVAFDLVGLRGITGSKLRWLYLVFAVPIRALYFRRSEEFYFVEIDAERPHEAEFLAEWLRPEITLWVSVGRTHAVQFEAAVASGEFKSLDTAIVHAFAQVPRFTTGTVYINGESEPMIGALAKLQKAGLEAKVVALSPQETLKRYAVYPSRTDFIFKNATFHFAQPQPRELALQLLMVERLARELKTTLKTDFSSMPVPPGRSSYFEGQRGVKIIDSSYNAHLISMRSVLGMVRELKAGRKWLIIGDMVDEGGIEAEEHRELARLIAEARPELVILVGRRTKMYTAPELKKLGVNVRTTVDPKRALAFIRRHITGAETLIFKGSQYLEWIIEKLLKNPEDAELLCRREKSAVKRRAKWGLK